MWGGEYSINCMMRCEARRLIKRLKKKKTISDTYPNARKMINAEVCKENLITWVFNGKSLHYSVV